MRLTSTNATDLEIWQAKIQAAPAANGYSQLAPAIWIGRCLANGTSMTRWTPDTLRGFLSFLDTLNITRLGIWPNVWSRKALTVTLAPRYSDHERDGALSVDVRGVARVEGPCVLVPRVSLQRVEGLRHAASVTESVV